MIYARLDKSALKCIMSIQDYPKYSDEIGFSITVDSKSMWAKLIVVIFSSKLLPWFTGMGSFSGSF